MLGEWIAEHCISDPDNAHRKAATQELFAAWTAYAKANNEPIGSIRSFSQTLEKRGFCPVKNVPTAAGKRVRGFAGIEMRRDHDRRQGQEA
jgi:putative DNA primase/helicase